MLDLDLVDKIATQMDNGTVYFREFSFEYGRKPCSLTLEVEPAGKGAVCLKEAGLVTLLPPNPQGAPKMFGTVLYNVMTWLYLTNNTHFESKLLRNSSKLWSTEKELGTKNHIRKKEMSLPLNFMDISSLCQVCGGIYVGDRMHSWIRLSLLLTL